MRVLLTWLRLIASDSWPMVNVGLYPGLEIEGKTGDIKA
jgi:hypothetical protein